MNTLRTTALTVTTALEFVGKEALLLAESPSYSKAIYATALMRHKLGYRLFKNRPEDIIHFSANWVRHHMPVFQPSVSLFSALLLTDVSDVLISDIHLPFSTFVVVPPQSLQWKISINNISHLVEAIFLHDFLGVSADNIRLEKYKSAYRRGDIVTAMQGEERCWSATLVYSGEFFGPGNPVHNFTVGEWLTYCGEPPVDDFHKGLKGALPLLAPAVRVLVGLALYIAEHGKGKRVEPHTSKPRRRRAGIEATSNRPTLYVIGENIKLGNELVDAAKLSISNNAHALWKVRRRFVVRGHYRNQACGTGRTERRLQWIQPHWKGPRDGERLSHIYEAGDQK